MRDGVDVHLCEVGLRDGLQNIRTFFPTDQKLAWIEAEAAAGMPEIEVCSFVPPKLLPQFADAGAVCAGALKIAGTDGKFVVSALMPNLKGAENGIAAGVHKLNYVTSVSEGHNMANVRRTTDESVEAFRQIVALRDEKAKETGHRVRLLAGLATSFGCTIEGKVDPAAVLKLAEKFLDAGADELSVADTVGYANPAQVKSLLKMMFDAFGADLKLTRGAGSGRTPLRCVACRPWRLSLCAGRDRQHRHGRSGFHAGVDGPENGRRPRQARRRTRDRRAEPAGRDALRRYRQVGPAERICPGVRFCRSSRIGVRHEHVRIRSFLSRRGRLSGTP